MVGEQGSGRDLEVSVCGGEESRGTGLRGVSEAAPQGGRGVESCRGDGGKAFGCEGDSGGGIQELDVDVFGRVVSYLVTDGPAERGVFWGDQ